MICEMYKIATLPPNTHINHNILASDLIRLQEKITEQKPVLQGYKHDLANSESHNKILRN